MNIRVPSDIPGMNHLLTLPAEYDHMDLKVCVYDEQRLVVTSPGCEPLWVDRRTGESKKMEPLEFWRLPVVL